MAASRFGFETRENSKLPIAKLEIHFMIKHYNANISNFTYIRGKVGVMNLSNIIVIVQAKKKLSTI